MSEFSTVTSGSLIESAWANAILDHGLTKPYDYVIRLDNSTARAINGKTGKADYSNSDLGIVLNNCISAVSNNGSFLIKGSYANNYNLSTQVSIPQDSFLRFHGEGGPHEMVSTQIESSISLPFDTGDSLINYYCEIKNMRIRILGGASPRSGLRIKTGRGCLENLYIVDTYEAESGVGFEFESGGLGWRIKNIHLKHFDIGFESHGEHALGEKIYVVSAKSIGMNLQGRDSIYILPHVTGAHDTEIGIKMENRNWLLYPKIETTGTVAAFQMAGNYFFYIFYPRTPGVTGEIYTWASGTFPGFINQTILTELEVLDKYSFQRNLVRGKSFWHDDFYGDSLDAKWRSTGNAGGSATPQSDIDGGVLRITTNASDTDAWYLDFNGLTTIRANQNPVFEVRAKLNQTTNQVVQFGLYRDATHHLLLGFDTSIDTEWYGIKYGQGASSRKQADLAFDTDWHIFRIAIDNDAPMGLCIIDDETTQKAEFTANLPVVYLQPYLYVMTRENVAKSVDIDYVVFVQDR